MPAPQVSPAPQGATHAVPVHWLPEHMGCQSAWMGQSTAALLQVPPTPPGARYEHINPDPQLGADVLRLMEDRMTAHA